MQKTGAINFVGVIGTTTTTTTTVEPHPPPVLECRAEAINSTSIQLQWPVSQSDSTQTLIMKQTLHDLQKDKTSE